jgi:hypothetical protein
VRGGDNDDALARDDPEDGGHGADDDGAVDAPDDRAVRHLGEDVDAALAAVVDRARSV